MYLLILDNFLHVPLEVFLSSYLKLGENIFFHNKCQCKFTFVYEGNHNYLGSQWQPRKTTVSGQGQPRKQLLPWWSDNFLRGC